MRGVLLALRLGCFGSVAIESGAQMGCSEGAENGKSGGRSSMGGVRKSLWREPAIGLWGVSAMRDRPTSKNAKYSKSNTWGIVHADRIGDLVEERGVVLLAALKDASWTNLLFKRDAVQHYFQCRSAWLTQESGSDPATYKSFFLYSMPSRTHPKKPFNVLIVDDHDSVAFSYAFVFKHRGHTADIALDAEAALLRCKQAMPDVVLSDLTLPGKSGIELLEALREMSPKPLVVFTTGSTCPIVVHRAMSAKPDGFVMKVESMNEILHTVEEVVDGRTVFTREVMDLDRRGAVSKLGREILLSAAEDSVLRLLALGKTTKEIAMLRHSSESTVEKQRGAILAKLGVHRAVEAVNEARRIGLVP